MRELFADSYYFLALLAPRDSAHGLANTWAQWDGLWLVTTEYVLVEVGDAFSAPARRAYFHKLLALVRAHRKYEVVPASEALFGAGAELHLRRPDKEWSLTDCISFAVMADYGISEALTGDRHFEQAGFTALLK